jgi:hypothetical protein
MDGAVLKRIVLFFSKPQGLGLGLGLGLIPTCSHKTEFSFLNGNLVAPARPSIHLQCQLGQPSHPVHGHEGSAKSAGDRTETMSTRGEWT